MPSSTCTCSSRVLGAAFYFLESRILGTYFYFLEINSHLLLTTLDINVCIDDNNGDCIEQNRYGCTVIGNSRQSKSISTITMLFSTQYVNTW